MFFTRNHSNHVRAPVFHGRRILSKRCRAQSSFGRQNPRPVTVGVWAEEQHAPVRAVIASS